MRRIVIVTVFVVLAAGIILPALTGCDEPPPQPGRVIARDIDTCSRRGCYYTLITTDSQGHTSRGDVSAWVYWHCHKGDQYPACAGKGGRK